MTSDEAQRRDLIPPELVAVPIDHLLSNALFYACDACELKCKNDPSNLCDGIIWMTRSNALAHRLTS